MANLTFQNSDFVSSRTDLPIIQNLTDVLPSSRFEADAYGHWVFYDDSPLIDRAHQRTLNLQSGAAIQPIFSSQGVALTNAKGSALLSDLVDSSDTSITAIYVAKTSSLALYLMGMSLTNTSSTTENGFGAYAGIDSADSKPKIFLNVKPAIASSAGGFLNLTTGQEIQFNTPFLVAVSIDKLKKTALLYTLKGNVESFISTSYTANYDQSSKKIAIGNAYYTAAESGTRTTFAEAILYNKALGLNQIKAVAQRCKTRLAAKNIII
ncbi:hypothetical protein [Acinetobacter pittii]|uniref:hypothetical protein n=1 Tax=Acinetobacter pittii TaxID=48296 RepID=UPI0021CD76BA|nr:hypothetical protein [Acinetobacter pittii]MCU4331946.1 hypothetical protein [Acinetobacter pittii]